MRWTVFVRRGTSVVVNYLACAFLVVAQTTTAHAGGFNIPEIGVRRTAMGAVIGRPDDPSSIYHNPAGLVLQDDWVIYVSAGLSLLSTEFELAPWDQSDRFLGTTATSTGYYAPVKPSRAFGVIPMIAVEGKLTDKLHVGASVFVGNAQGASFKDTDVTRYHLIDGYVIAPQIVIGAAYQVTPTLALGATVGAIDFIIHGERDVFPIVDGADLSKLTGTAPRLTLDGSGWAPTYMIGAYGNPHPRITWGAAIVGKVNATLNGPINVAYSADASSPGDMLVGQQTTQQMLPWTFQAGVNVDVTPNIEVGTELRYWLYRQYKNQHTDIVGIFLLRELDTEKDYHDSQEWTGGVRVHDLPAIPKLDLMMGAQYDHSPAPPDTITLDSPSFSHFGLHSGARYSFGRYRLGASYIHYWYEVPTITGSITMPPTNIRGSGSNNIFTLSLEAHL
jgi:long-subunit fatty acid transport protein